MSNITRFNRVPTLLGHSIWDDFISDFFTEPTELVRRSTEGYPVTDIYKDDDGNSVIECALAGFSKDDIAIEVKDAHITITADGGSDASAAQSRRIARRSFTRTYVDHSGKLDLTQTTANFENGLLRVTVPPTPEAQPKMITIS